MIDRFLTIFRRQASRTAESMPSAPAGPAIAEWNAASRRYVTELNGLIADSYEGREILGTEPRDQRTLDQARAVIATVEAEDRAGRWHADSPIADRAHEPFIDMLDDVCQNLNCVCILGADEFLVRLGTSYKRGPALHLRGGEVVERPDILAAAVTRSHDMLLLVREQGFSVSHGLDDEPVSSFPWPEGVTPTALDILQISEDGRTIAFVENDRAVWLGQARGANMAWTQAFPTVAFLAERKTENEEDDDDFPWSDSMMHCALSPDGQFIAYGSQCYGHFIDRIDGLGEVRRWAEIAPGSEYPHYATFSNDGAVAALNSCHFYHGATLGIRVGEVEGREIAAYEQNQGTTLINNRLRVYAATWLPIGAERDGFALAGAGYLDIVSAGGDVRSNTSFGSSASSIDYCPRTGMLAVASYSGFLHIFDPTKPAEQGTTIGYRPIRERYRWVLWRDRGPFRW